MGHKTRSPQTTKDENCSLSDFAPLFDVPKVALSSLQAGPRADEFNRLGKHSEVVRDLSAEQRDLGDTALIMNQLDLIISVDTAVLHLSRARVQLGGLLSTRCDWRWMRDRTDSPRYPSLCLFRQEDFNDWSELMMRVAAQLEAMCRQF